MAKYKEDFKREVVDRYLNGDIGFRSLGNELGLSPRLIRSWVGSYRHHGQAGLTKKHSHYDARFKLSVLQKMWRDRLSATQTMALFDLRGGAGVVTLWERLYLEWGLTALKPKPKGRPVKMQPPERSVIPPVQDKRTIDELRKENEYLRAEVAYLKKRKALIQAKKIAEQKKRG
jgi:transposase